MLFGGFQAKLTASVRWLIRRVYDREVPDLLSEVAVRGEQVIVLTQPSKIGRERERESSPGIERGLLL